MERRKTYPWNCFLQMPISTMNVMYIIFLPHTPHQRHPFPSFFDFLNQHHFREGVAQGQNLKNIDRRNNLLTFSYYTHKL